MKQYLALLFSFCAMGCGGQSNTGGLVPRRDIDILKYHTWTDGELSYKCVSREKNLYKFSAGTEHEKVSMFILKDINGEFIVEEPSGHSAFTRQAKGRTVKAKLDEDKEALIFYTQTDTIATLQLLKE